MEKNNSKNSFLTTVLKSVDKFYNSDLFIALYSAIIFLSWYIENEYIAVVSSILILCYMFLTQKSLDRMIMIAIIVPAFVDNNMRHRISFSQLYILVPLVLLVVASAIYHFIKVHKPNGKQFSKSQLFLGYLIVAFSGIIGGLGYPGQTIVNVILAFSVGLALFGLYALLYKCTSNESKYTVYKSIVFLCIVIIAQMLTYCMRTENLQFALSVKAMSLGWAITNSIAVVLAMGIPLCFYLASKHKFQFGYMLLASIFYAFIFLTHSRSMMAAGTAIYFVCLVLSFVKLNKWQAAAHLLLVVGVGIFAALNLYEELFEQFLIYGIGGNGREALYTYYFQKFKDNKWFGMGFFTDTEFQADGMVRVHNTILQILASTGIVGVLTFLPMYYQRYKLLFSNFSWFKVFAIISYAAFAAYGLVDCAIISSYKLIIVYLLLFAVECDNDDTLVIKSRQKLLKR